jgi:hypothetical protein
MKRIAIAISLLLMVAVIVSLKPGRAQEVRVPEPQAGSKNQAAANPLKVALLKWYPANLTTSFKVGKDPVCLAFDGANIWVANNDDATVSKLQANDGSNLGTFSVGYGPVGLAFDGANIWVANSFDNTVTKLRASDGKNLGTFPVGQVPYYLAFDGEAVWVTNTESTSVTKLRASDGKNLGTFADHGAPGGIVFDGTHIWVSSFNTVTRFKLDGQQEGTFQVPSSFGALAFDGVNIWVPNNGGTVTKLRASDGKLLGTFNAGNADGSGIAFDGQNLWLSGGPYIVEMRPSDGAVLFQKLLKGGLAGIGFDGANVWVAGDADGIVFKL